MIRLPAINNQAQSAHYFMKNKWPRFDFEKNKIRFFPPRPANNRLAEEHVTGISI
jgi:hypothetical protein